MKTRLTALAIVASALTSFQAPAFADQALATAKNCMACHAVDKKMVGPSYKDVAAKYAGNKDAAAMLAEKIQKGSTPGKGNWGAVPMPANPQVNAAEAAKLAAWVLAVK
jgi:cytochrome c